MKENIKKQIFEELDKIDAEVYVDYRDYEHLESFVAGCENVTDFCDKLYDAYEESISYEENEVINNLAEKFEIKLGSEEYDELVEIVRDNLCVTVPVENFLRQEVRVNVLTNFYNDEKYSFTTDGWLRWIMKSQGYKLSDYPMLKEYSKFRYLVPVPGASYYRDPVKNDWNDVELNKYNNKFLKSMLQEVNNQIIDYMRTFTFLATVTIEDYFKLKSGDYKSITFNKDVMCGLYNPWNGSGSLLEIELEKGVTVQKKNIYQVQLEGAKEKNCGGYKVDEVYGLVHSCWKSEASVK